MEYVECTDASGSGALLVEGALYVVAARGPWKKGLESVHPGGGPRGMEGLRCHGGGGFVILSPFYTRGCRNLITWPYLWARDRFIELGQPHSWKPPSWADFTLVDVAPWDEEGDMA